MCVQESVCTTCAFLCALRCFMCRAPLCARECCVFMCASDVSSLPCLRCCSLSVCCVPVVKERAWVSVTLLSGFLFLRLALLSPPYPPASLLHHTPPYSSPPPASLLPVSILLPPAPSCSLLPASFLLRLVLLSPISSFESSSPMWIPAGSGSNGGEAVWP